MIICVCQAISEKDLDEIVNKGHNTLQKVQRVSKARIECGLCTEKVKSFLREYRKAQKES